MSDSGSGPSDDAVPAQVAPPAVDPAVAAAPPFQPPHSTPQNGAQQYPPPQFGAPLFGAPQFGAPQFGAPQYGAPQFGAPKYGAPQYGAPQYDAPLFDSTSAGYPAPPPFGAATTPAIALGGDDVRGDLRSAAAVIGVLGVLGLLAGVLWGVASPHSLGFVSRPGLVIPNETEQFIGADGRYVLITAIIGVIAGVLCWGWRARRGPVLAIGLAVGGLLGAVLTAAVGHLVGGGHAGGALNARITLPITLHARGLIAVEPVVALLVYLAGTLLSGPDDLGRSPAGTAASTEDAADSTNSVDAGGYH